MTTILASLSGLRLCLVTAGLVSGCILVTYALCLDEKQCPVFLPMISDTFVPIPGNYISRMVFSAGQFGLGAVMIMDYYSYRMINPGAACATKFWLVITLVATVCLGIVGAVCESDTAPTCLANGTLHSDSAMFLYITLDLYAVSCALFEFKTPRCTARKVLMLLLPLVSVATKARWSSTVLAALSPSDVALAVVEWLDTAVLMSWIVIHCKRTYYGDFCTGYVTTATTPTFAAKKTADDEPSVLLSASLLELCNTFAAVSVGTVALTFVIATHNGKVDPSHEWPMLSDLWADKPTNMISRYFVCLGAGVTMLEQAGHLFLAAPHRTGAPKANGALHALSLAALLGLSGVGACNEKELGELHFAFANLFFGGMAPTWRSTRCGSSTATSAATSSPCPARTSRRSASSRSPSTRTRPPTSRTIWACSPCRARRWPCWSGRRGSPSCCTCASTSPSTPRRQSTAWPSSSAPPRPRRTGPLCCRASLSRGFETERRRPWSVDWPHWTPESRVCVFMLPIKRDEPTLCLRGERVKALTAIQSEP